MPVGDVRWTRFVHGPVFVPLVVLLVGLRFAASTVTSYAGIQGIDTRGLDTALDAYSYALILLLLFLTAVLCLPWARSSSGRDRFLLFFALAVATVLQWLGTVDPALRFVGGPMGPWADFLLGMTATAAVASFTSWLTHRPAWTDARSASREGLRAFGFGFAAAYLLRSVRLLDFTYLFGWVLPSGLVWLLNFGPSLLLAGLAILFWARLDVARARDTRARALSLAIPVLLALTGLAAAVGVLGGFILSNALAWGGSYLVFSPTALSLSFVGFGVGAFLSTTWAVRRRIPRPAWRLVFGGIAIAALAGIQTSAGTLASIAGLLTGIACTARGVSELVSS